MNCHESFTVYLLIKFSSWCGNPRIVRADQKTADLASSYLSRDEQPPRLHRDNVWWARAAPLAVITGLWNRISTHYSSPNSSRYYFGWASVPDVDSNQNWFHIASRKHDTLYNARTTRHLQCYYLSKRSETYFKGQETSG